MTDAPTLFEADDPWGWWRAACATPHLIGTESLPVHSEPRHGFFRVRRKGGQWEPVQIWRDDSEVWHGMRNGREVDAKAVGDLWIWACRAPISDADYDAALGGAGFVDEPERAPGIGHNLAEADPLDALTIEYLGEREQADTFLKSPITTQADADRAAIWARRLADIAGKATALHKVEKQPSLDEGRRIDDRWRDLREGAAGMSQALKRHQTAWLRELERRENVRVAAATAEADRLRKEARAAALAAEAAQLPAQIADAGRKVAEAQEAARQAEFRPAASGRTGARTTLRNFTSAEIVDFDALLMSLKDRAEVRELVQRLADALARAGAEVPGMKIKVERRPV